MIHKNILRSIYRIKVFSLILRTGKNVWSKHHGMTYPLFFQSSPTGRQEGISAALFLDVYHTGLSLLWHRCELLRAPMRVNWHCGIYISMRHLSTSSWSALASHRFANLHHQFYTSDFTGAMWSKQLCDPLFTLATNDTDDFKWQIYICFVAHVQVLSSIFCVSFSTATYDILHNLQPNTLEIYLKS